MATQREVAGHCNKLTKQQKVEENQVCGGPENLSSLPPSFGVKPRAVYAVVNIGGKGYFYIYHVAEAGWQQEAVYLPTTVPETCAAMSGVSGVGSGHGTLSLSWD